MIRVPLPASIPAPAVVEIEDMAEPPHIPVVHPPALPPPGQDLPIQHCHHQEPVGSQLGLGLARGKTHTFMQVGQIRRRLDLTNGMFMEVLLPLLPIVADRIEAAERILGTGERLAQGLEDVGVPAAGEHQCAPVRKEQGLHRPVAAHPLPFEDLLGRPDIIGRQLTHVPDDGAGTQLAYGVDEGDRSTRGTDSAAEVLSDAMYVQALPVGSEQGGVETTLADPVLPSIEPNHLPDQVIAPIGRVGAEKREDGAALLVGETRVVQEQRPDARTTRSSRDIDVEVAAPGPHQVVDLSGNEATVGKEKGIIPIGLQCPLVGLRPPDPGTQAPPDDLDVDPGERFDERPDFGMVLSRRGRGWYRLHDVRNDGVA